MDVDPFVQSMVWGPYSVNADMNQDGQVNGLDVDPFVAVVLGAGTSLTPIPEPSTMILATMALLGAPEPPQHYRQRRRRQTNQRPTRHPTVLVARWPTTPRPRIAPTSAPAGAGVPPA
jgi:hypothetical protein